MKKYFRDYLGLLIVSGTVVILDQWTKALVRTGLSMGETWLPGKLIWLAPYARIVNWYNTGAAFGIFQGGALVFTILAFLVIGAILYYYPHTETNDRVLRFAMGMQMGGAFGNLIDRLTMGGKVTDFISLGKFPVFNIADSSISIGVAVLLLGLWIKERNVKRAVRIEPDELEKPSSHGGPKESSDIQIS
jgi:signal peptidase II